VLAWPLIRAAVAMLDEMDSVDSTGIATNGQS
jgi:hypothetical protein